MFAARNMMFARSAATASPLLTDLIDWWDSGSLTGQHAGGVLGDSTSHNLAGDPFGGTTAFYAGSTTLGDAINQTFRPAPPTNIDTSLPHTLAGVYYRDGSQFYWQRDSTVLSNCIMNVVIGSASYGGASSPVGYSPSSGTWPNAVGWGSIVLTYDSTTLRLYVDGSLVDSAVVALSGTGKLGGPYFFRVGNIGRLAVMCQATRAWDQTDVDLFHNGGSFVRYSDLPQ